MQNAYRGGVGLRLDDLEVFMEVIRRGSLSAAARSLNVSQPTVTRRIQRLEREIGELVLERSVQAASPTRAGLAVLRFADQVLAAYRQLAEELSRPAAASGELELATSTTPAEEVVPRLVVRFSALEPAVQVHMHVMDSESVEACVAERHCDVGFMGRRPRPGLLVAAPVAEDELCLVVPEGHPLAGRGPVAPEEILSLPFVERRPGSGTRETVEQAFRQAGIPFHAREVVMEASSPHALIAAVRLGRGVGFVSRLLAARATGVVGLPVLGVPLVRPLYLVYRPDRLSPAAVAFVRMAVPTAALEVERGRTAPPS
jgi:DNA-binding transcriptional LysR family regulator